MSKHLDPDEIRRVKADLGHWSKLKLTALDAATDKMCPALCMIYDCRLRLHEFFGKR